VNYLVEKIWEYSATRTYNSIEQGVRRLPYSNCRKRLYSRRLSQLCLIILKNILKQL